MSKFGAQPIHDASKGVPTTVYKFEDDERIERRPSGKVERFVDPQGNVVSLQLAPAGDPNPTATSVRIRAELRREGFVEHAKCPIRHGVRLASKNIERDFLTLADNDPSMDRPCDDDPKIMIAKGSGVSKTLHAQKSCRHVEWLIDFRRAREKSDNEKRFASRAEQEKREASKRELETLQIEEAKERAITRKANRKPKVHDE